MLSTRGTCELMNFLESLKNLLMRKQVAAANWKMNLTFQQGERLLDDIITAGIRFKEHQQVIFAVPFPYLLMTRSEVEGEHYYSVAAQNCHHKKMERTRAKCRQKCFTPLEFHIASWGIVSAGNILVRQM